MTRGAASFERVTKSFGRFTAIPDFSLEIAPGALTTLLGPSGCGKTTILRLLAGLDQPTSGRIRIGGAEVSALPPEARDLSMVFQSHALFPHLSVLENVAYGLRAGRMKSGAARGKAAEWLKLVGLEGCGPRAPATLSGGERQRVALARALAREPQLLLLDEPLSSLDLRLRRRLRAEIRELQQRLGFTALYVTHDQEEALAISDRIVVMREGRIAQQGTPREIYGAPASAFVADFIGEASLLHCVIESLPEGLSQVRIGGLTLHLPAPEGLKPGPALLAIRPEAAFLSPLLPETVFSGRILRASYLGRHMEYELETPAGRLLAADSRLEPLFAPGESAAVDLRPQGLTLLPG